MSCWTKDYYSRPKDQHSVWDLFVLHRLGKVHAIVLEGNAVEVVDGLNGRQTPMQQGPR